MDKQLTNNSRFNSEDAIFLCGMCFQTYQYFEIGKLILPKSFELRYTICGMAGVEKPKSEIFGFVAESEDNIIIAFRGSDSEADKESELDLFQVSYPYAKGTGKTHRGITAVYQSIRNAIISEIDKLEMTKKLYITGHSLGANLAILSAVDIAYNTKFERPKVYTYGAGRVGNLDFVSMYNSHIKDSFRIYNVHDLVSTLPHEEYKPPFTKEGLYYKHVMIDFPLCFQLDNMVSNNEINNYFKYISQKNPLFAQELSSENPGFCPNI